LLKGITQTENSIKASYLIAERTAKFKKPFVYGELVNECLQCTADIICKA
jgi:hypothetical protein